MVFSVKTGQNVCMQCVKSVDKQQTFSFYEQFVYL
jgi:hypothetical protein